MRHEPRSLPHPGTGSFPRSVVRFGAYELDSRAGELRKHGYKIRLQNKPLRILELLLEQRGEVVTREELREQLWPQNVFVDFDHGLNSAVNKLRDALCDSAADPRFIETTPRGYRFIGEVAQLTAVALPEAHAPSDATVVAAPAGPPRRRPIWWKLAPVSAVVVAVVGFAVLVSRLTLSVGARPSDLQRAVAILPFENLSADPEQEFFSDGFTDELIGHVGRVAPDDLRVIARASTMRYKRTDKTPDQIGRELAVDYILEGSVLRAGDRVRIIAQLVRTRDQAHVWSQSYERHLRDVLALQSEVARAIAEEIEITFKRNDRRPAHTSTNVDPAVYEAYLKGRYFVDRSTKTPQAIDYFEKAIAIDPSYAPAYAGLADAYGQMGWALSTETPPEHAYPRALRAAEQALTLDEGLASAHVALARIRWKYEFNFPSAEQSLARATELDPNSAVAHESYFDLLSAMGRHDEAHARLRRAAALDPVSLTINYDFGLHFTRTGDYDRAVEWLKKAIELDPASGFVHHLLGEAFAGQGNLAQATAALQKAIELSGANPHYLAVLAVVKKEGGDAAAPSRALAILEERATRTYVSPHSVAMVHAAAGRTDAALGLLERAYELRDPWLSLIHVQPQFTTLVDTARFKTLMRRMGLPHHH